MELKFATNAYQQNFRQGLKPDRDYTVSEWADEFRVLTSESSAEAGRWRTERTPYLKEIMDALSADSDYQRVTFMKGAQIGGSEAGNNWLGYIMHHSPAPVLAVQPTLMLAKRFSKQRIDPLINGCDVIKGRMGGVSKKESENTILEKKFQGGFLVLAGANSSAGLRQMPARFIFFDEIDDYPKDLEGQGDPVDLAKARSRTFAKRKWFENSTPTIEGESPIAESYESSDKRQCHLPCPSCGKYQVLNFQHLKWDETVENEKKRTSNVRYHCEACDYGIRNWQKTKMLAEHKWVAQNPGAGGGKHAGFHLSSLYSPVGWYSWEDLAQEWVDAQGNPEKLKTFINTVLGETWKEKTDTPGWRRLYERRETYPMRVIPEPVCFLTAGVDVQNDRLEMEIVGWCKNKVTYSIDYHVLMGDTSAEQVWADLREKLFQTFPLAGQNKNLSMGIKMAAIDSGYRTQTVYDFVRSLGSPRVIAIKGVDELNMVHGAPRKADVTIKGKTIRRGLQVWPIGVSLCKIELYGWLKQPKALDGDPDPYGYCHFPEYEPEYFKQLTAEKLTTKIVRGYKKREWKKERERNEALDTRVYARAAASILGMDRFKDAHWDKLKSNLKGIQPKAGGK